MPKLMLLTTPSRFARRRFGERIKSLLKPGGIFIFKGMSDDEENFRQKHEKESHELNIITVFQAVKFIVEERLRSDDGFLRNLDKVQLEFDVEIRSEKEILQILDTVAKKELDMPNGVKLDLSGDIAMPYHFRSDEIPHYFRDMMGFEVRACELRVIPPLSIPSLFLNLARRRSLSRASPTCSTTASPPSSCLRPSMP